MSTKRKATKRKADAIAATDEESGDLPKLKKQKLHPTKEEAPENVKMEEKIPANNNIDEVAGEQIELPPEILVSIFSQIELRDLSRVSCVSQHWWLCAKDASLTWSLMSTLELVEHSENYTGHGNGAIILLSDARKHLCSGKLQDLYRLQNVGYHYKMLDKNGNLLAIVNSDYNIPDLDGTAEHFRMKVLEGPDPSVVASNNRWTHHLAIEANYRMIENIIRSGEEVKGALILLNEVVRTFLRQFYRWAPDYLARLCDLTKAYTPTVLPIVTEQPEQLTGLKLHNYQISAINWMVTTEQDSDKGFEVSPLIPVIRGSSILAKIDLNEQKLVLSENARQYNVKLSPKGGILADEMGLGKTMEMLGLILANPMKVAPKNGSFFSTKATLIICPNHLIAQWASEIEKHTEPKLTVLQIPTMTQFKKFTYQQVLDADIVLVTSNMLKGKNYIAYPLEPHQITFGENSPHERIDRIDGLLEERKNKAPEKLKGVVLDHFHWHRIVLDEGHETLEDEFTMSVIGYMNSTYKWYMSGTPFPSARTLNRVRTFLGLAIPRLPRHDMKKLPELLKGATSSPVRDCFTFEAYVDETLDQLLVDNLFWRNTKESIKQEYKMVDTKQEVVLLEFTPIEAAIYEDLKFAASKANAPREFCCKLNYDWGNTLEVMKTFMTKKKEGDVRMAKGNVEAVKKRKQESEKKLKSNVTSVWDRRTYQKFLEDYPKTLVDREQTLKDHERIEKLFKELKSRDTSKFEYNSKDFLIENYGTKLAHLVLYLKKLFEKEPTTRVIVFSQFTDYLEMIGALLAENEISSSTVEGNVYKKTKALKQFKDDGSEVKVILLSLSKAASGTNLIEASHVLLMDPMTGTKEEAQAYENQAVGRAQRQGQTKPVTVVRFVIKNTIEHEYYVRNTGSNQHGQVTLNRSNSKLVRSSSFGTLLANQ
jgi:SNF2 family DNA or RNA helicase